MKKAERIITYSIISVALILIAVLGVSLERTMSRLSEKEPVVIYLSDSTVYQNNGTVYSEYISETAFTVASEPSTAEYETTDFTSESTENSVITTDDVADTEAINIADGTSSREPAATESAAPQLTSAASVNPEAAELFVTKSGKKYHLSGCSYLSKSCIPITYKEVLEGGYSPCSRCFNEEK